MKIRFSIRDLLLATVIVALLVAWWVDHRRMQDKFGSIDFVGGAGSIEGKVVYGDTGKPAAGVRVWIGFHTYLVILGSESRMGNVAAATTDNQGRYRFVNLLPGDYTLQVQAEGWTTYKIERTVSRYYLTDLIADFQLIQGGFIKGRIIDDDTGKPIGNVDGDKIRLGTDGPAGPTRPNGYTVVDPDGRFQIRVAPGKNFPYILNLRPNSIVKGDNYRRDGVNVEDGGTTEIEFRIKQSTK